MATNQPPSRQVLNLTPSTGQMTNLGSQSFLPRVKKAHQTNPSTHAGSKYTIRDLSKQLILQKEDD